MTAPRGAGGRFARRTDPQDTPPPAVGPVPGQTPLFALRVEPVDPGPRPPDDTLPPLELPADPAGGAIAGDPSEDARSLVAVALDAVDALVRRALGPDYGAAPDDLQAVKDAAVPVAVRAAGLIGAGDAVTRTLPEWALELVRLGARTWMAYGDAIAEAWALALAARRAELEDDDDPESGPAGAGDGGGRGGAGGGPESGYRGGGPAGVPGGAVRGPVAAAGRGGAAADDRARLAAALVPPRPVRP